MYVDTVRASVCSSVMLCGVFLPEAEACAATFSSSVMSVLQACSQRGEYSDQVEQRPGHKIYVLNIDTKSLKKKFYCQISFG